MGRRRAGSLLERVPANSSDPDDRLADPVGYSLWCDYFENRETVGEAWLRLAHLDELSERGVQRLLELSGPVPFGLKAPLYDKLASDPRWHGFVFRGLLSSGFDYFGDIDVKAARRLLARLTLPEETAGLTELRLKLELDR